jgi:hypothetical protein
MHLTDAEYWKVRNRLDVVSYGKLRDFMANPRAYKLGRAKEQSDPMIKGSLVDCLLFEPQSFFDRFEFRTETDKNGEYALRSNAAKAEYKAIQERGRTPIKPEWADDALAQVKAVHLSADTKPAPWSVLRKEFDPKAYLDALEEMIRTKTPIAGIGDVLNGEAQLGICRKLSANGVELSFCGKLDFRPGYGEYADAIVDAKLITPGTLDSWTNKVNDMSYHWQAASYLDIDRWQNPDTSRTRFIWLLIENKFPFDCGLVQCSASALEIGRAQYRKATERYAECLREDHWPSPYHTNDGLPAVVGLPDWAANKAWREIA